MRYSSKSNNLIGSVRKLLLVSMGVTFLLLPYLALAEAESMLGLSPSDIITQLGFPFEKIERESKRESLWRFSSGREVLFREGVVIQADWRHKKPAGHVAQKPSAEQPSAASFSFSTNELVSAMQEAEKNKGGSPPSELGRMMSGRKKIRSR